MFAKRSIQLKYVLIFLLTMALVMVALFAGLYQLKTKVLRNEGMAVANQVVAFRAWVAKAGMVWVDRLSPDFHDYLAKRPEASGKYFFGKNPALATRELSEIVGKTAQRATFRVTSDDYRSAANAPDAFESKAIQLLKADLKHPYAEGYEGEGYRYVQPIYVQEGCLKCHGDPKAAPPAVIEKYGAKRAFGYKVGDVRGVISVKLPDITLYEAALTFLNPYTLGLLLLAFLINYLYTQRSVLSRLRQLTRQTERIASGELDTELRYSKDSHDEIEHVYHSTDLLRNSLRVAMRHMQK